MAKQQTFGGKAAKKQEEEMISVKVIVASKTDKGSYRFNERFVKVRDLSEVEKAAREA